MIVTTIPEANVILTECGCCLMPIGAGPRLEYQSTYGEYNSEYDAEASDGALYTDGTITAVFANCTETGTYSYNYLLQGGTCSYELDAPTVTYNPTNTCDPATRGSLTSITYTGTTAYTPTIFIAEAVTNFNANKDFADPTCVQTGVNASQFSGVIIAQATFGDSVYSLDIINARFRVGVPLNYSTGPLPKTYYKVTWDTIAAKKTWWNWHDGGRTGTEPAGGVLLVTLEEWIWGGTMATPFSDWYDIPLEAAAVASETRVANMRYFHFQSARFGSLPVLTGPQVVTA
jgi:hypothetical protein